MEIKNTLSQLAPYTRTRRTSLTGAAPRKNTAAAPVETGDRVSLSSAARLRTEALSAASAAPEIRAAKVAEIKAKVDSGEYTVDSKTLATNLMQEEPGLFS